MMLISGVPLHLHGTPGSMRRAPRLERQHTKEILAELAYGPERIAWLVNERIAWLVNERSVPTSAEFEKAKQTELS